MSKAKVIQFKKPDFRAPSAQPRPKNEVLEAIIRSEDDREQQIQEAFSLKKELESIKIPLREHVLYYSCFVLALIVAILLITANHLTSL